MSSEFPWWGWAIFSAAVLGMLAIDLVAHRKHDADSKRRAIGWSIVWIGVGLAFAGFVWWMFGSAPAQEYIAAYLIEKSLSLDNMFVFLIVFQMLNIPEEHHRRVLTWGIFGALIFRALFVFAGAAVLERWNWVSYVFGAILLIAAWRVFREDPARKEQRRLVEWLDKHLPVTKDVGDGRFFARHDGKRVATPLLIALIAVELTDIAFAIDSIPAAFSVSRDTFVVYSSNVFAILGLRSLYIVLAKLITDLPYLHYGLAAVLAFAGIKMVIHDWFEIPIWASIAIIMAIITTAVIASLSARRKGGLHTTESHA